MTANGVKPRPERVAAPAGRAAEVVAGGLERVGFIDMRASQSPQRAPARHVEASNAPGFGEEQMTALFKPGPRQLHGGRERVRAAPLARDSAAYAGSGGRRVPPPSPSPLGPHMHTRILVRHEGNTPRERSTCGWRDRLISREDQALGPAAWTHAVDIDGARPHYHKRSTELYYVLEGDGVVLLDGEEHPVRKGSLVHIPPGVVHGARGRMRVLVVGIPDIAEDDYFEA
jgi:mannose-6-phosphate isomerase-like protein (cupin superfamily)